MRRAAGDDQITRPDGATEILRGLPDYFAPDDVAPSYKGAIRLLQLERTARTMGEDSARFDSLRVQAGSWVRMGASFLSCARRMHPSPVLLHRWRRSARRGNCGWMRRRGKRDDYSGPLAALRYKILWLRRSRARIQAMTILLYGPRAVRPRKIWQEMTRLRAKRKKRTKLGGKARP